MGAVALTGAFERSAASAAARASVTTGGGRLRAVCASVAASANTETYVRAVFFAPDASMVGSNANAGPAVAQASAITVDGVPLAFHVVGKACASTSAFGGTAGSVTELSTVLTHELSTSARNALDQGFASTLAFDRLVGNVQAV